MKEETRELLKEGLSRMNNQVSKVKSILDRDWVKEKLLMLYFSSPPKVQSALAKYVVNSVVNKNRNENNELIRH